MSDWYFAGLFEETFSATVGNHMIHGRTAAEVLRVLVAEASEPDLTWIGLAQILDMLCVTEIAFELKRNRDKIQWVLNPFRDSPDASGSAPTIGEAIDALHAAARCRYQTAWPKVGIDLV
jgi:hypothetical protein